MAKIERQEVIQEVVEGLRLDAGRDPLPTRSSDIIQPVFVANPAPIIQIKTGTASDALSQTIFTTSETKKTFLIGVQLSGAKDVVSTSLSSSILATLKGQAARVIDFIHYEPVTAGEFGNNLMFPIPLLLEPNTIVAVQNSTAIASIDTSALIFIYEIEP